ncbi:MAG: alpha/beta fold hydrolase [Burkholderiales bacterium]|jgi:predicted alpha/beta-fold hydrolase|nr:alpha/beta fold hydrolase [Burkholderiales bacterium]
MLNNTTSPHGKRIASDYVCPRWLVGAHAQTVWPLMQPRAPVAWRRERIATPDHDFWDFDWLDAPAKDSAPLVILFHGLEGNSRSHYACSMMAAVARRGWHGVVPHFRGCSGELNLTPRAYHMGDYNEISAMLDAIRARVPKKMTLYAVGVSLGGSALLNWLGRSGKNATDSLAAVAAVSTPIDLERSGRAFGKGLNRLYERNFMGTLKRKALAIAKRHPDKIDLKKVAAVRTLTDFDDTVTAPLHGFKDVADYRRRASSRPWLNKIEIPTLLLNALNDPLVPADSLPGEKETSPCVWLERPDKGGHAGFPVAAGLAHAWMPQRVLTFFEQHR